MKNPITQWLLRPFRIAKYKRSHRFEVDVNNELRRLRANTKGEDPLTVAERKLRRHGLSTSRTLVLQEASRRLSEGMT